MARKDVDLVIRAKNDAEKVLKAVVSELGELVQAQKEVGQTGEQVESRLSRLGASLSNLDKQFKGFTATEKINKQLAEMTAGMDQLGAKTLELAVQQGKYTEAAREAATATERFKQESAEVTKTVEAQQKAVAETAEKQRDLTRALRLTTAERQRAIGADADLTAKIREQQAAVDKTAAKYVELATRMAATEQPSKGLQTQLDRAAAALERQQTALTKITNEHASNRAAIQAAAAAELDLRQRLEETTAKIIVQGASLEKTIQQHRELGEQIKASAQNQKRLATSAETAAEALAETANELNQAQVAMRDFGQTSVEAAQAVGRLSQQGGAALQRTFLDFRKEVDESRNTMLMAKATATELGRAYKTAAEPTADMEIAFNEAREAARRSTEEYQANVRALQQLRTMSFRQVGPQQDPTASLTRDRADMARILMALDAEHKAIERNSVARTKAAATGKQVAAGNAQVAASTQAVTTATTQAAAASSRLSEAWKVWYGEGRSAMSIMQRLRGEVLGYIAAYSGISAVVTALRRTVTVFQEVEAAQSRLNVAFAGDQRQAGQEFEWIQRQAQRLGLEIGGLAGEYGKFAVATQGTNLAGENTRKIFLAVAEASRVNNVSFDDMKGVFNALTQIVSKGAVQMEELRQQLGDRLPGALKLMADGLGVTSAQLIKMMEQGAVTSDSLVQLADQMNRKFGPELGKSLMGTTAQLGFFQNALTQAFITFGNAGFIDRFNAFLQTMTETLQSSDAQAFFANLGKFMGGVMDTLGVLIVNFDKLITLFGALAGIQIWRLFRALAPDIALFNRQLFATAPALTATTAAMSGVAVSSTAATGAVARLTLALRTLTSGTLIGAALTAVVALLTYFATQADEASDAMHAHKGFVDQVKLAYDLAGGSAEKFQAEVRKIKTQQIKDNIDDLRASLIRLARQMETELPGGLKGMAQQDVTAQLRSIFQAYQAGSIDAKTLKQSVLDLAEAFPVLRKKMDVDALVRQIEEMDRLEESVKKNELILKMQTGTAEEAQAALKELRGEVKALGDAFGGDASTGAERFQKALDKLKEGIPELAEEMKALKELAEIDTMFGVGPQLPEVQALIDARKKAIAATMVDKSDIANLIGGIESSGRADAKNPNSSATGLGQFIESTWTRMFQQYFPDRAKNMSREAILMLRNDAEISNSMIRLYARENAEVLQNAGQSVTKMSTYLAHFLGPQGAVKVLKAAPDTPVSELLSQGAISANQSVLGGGKTAAEVIAWAQKKTGISREELEIHKQLTAEENKRFEETRKNAEKTGQRLTDMQEEVKQATLVNQKKEREAAIEKEIAEARKENPDVTPEQLAQVRAYAAAKWDQLNATKGAEEAEARFNQLLEQRALLNDQLRMYREQGDFNAVEQTRLALEGLNGQLQSAGVNAIEMWRKIGGPEADAAVLKIQTSMMTVAAAAKQTWIDWQKVGTTFASTLTNAFDQFAQKVAEGVPVMQAAREAFLQFASDFLRQIGQMIIQQAILNALKMAFPGFMGAGIAHGGGIAGSSNRSRRVDPGVFANAMRLHSGGIPGLKANEVPTILERGEEVLTKSDPRHILNGGGATTAAAAPVEMAAPKIVNAFDTASFLEEALNTRVGERAILNFVRANPGAFKAAIGGSK